MLQSGDKYWGCPAEKEDALASCFCYILHGKDPDEGGLPSSGGAGAAGQQDAAGAQTLTPVPDGWFHPYLIIAAAWSPWSGHCPTQFKNLEASEGKAPTDKKGDKIGSGPLSSPGALAESTASARKMENSDGFPVSRRAHQAALKADAERVRREKRDKENIAHHEQGTALRRQALAAIQKGNDNSEKLVASMSELVTLKRNADERAQAEAEAAKKKTKIESIQLLLVMPNTDKAALHAQMAELLMEQLNA